MSTKIRIGIVGYGNLGRGVEIALSQSPDMELVAVFTRRDPASVQLLGRSVPVRRLDDVVSRAGDSHGSTEAIDVMILCGSSKGDLPEQGPALAERFNTVDSFDTHAEIPRYFDSVDSPARAGGNLAVISTGWDPGLFSINRLYGEAILPEGATYTFWGKGLSQGHSAAVRQVPGVADAVQYTIPSSEAMEKARSGSRPELSTREKHVRECYVVIDDAADEATVEQAIVTMPDYFADYETQVYFVSADELAQGHSAMPHGGFVIRSGATGDDSNQTMEFNLALGSNPHFTASVLVAYARAAFRLNCQGEVGARTPFDIAPGLLSPKSPVELRKELL